MSTVDLHLSGLIGTTGHPDMKKIRIIFLIGCIGSLKVGSYYLRYVIAPKPFE